MKKLEAKFQIGKSGLTDNFIETLKTAFKTHRQVRIHILKSAGHDKNKVKEIAEEISKKLPFKTEYKTIGFVIIVMKH